ncbi:hypothetical protein MNBD_GAMMA06-6 [hydrothermal vent metagenome]|uniref:Uncharacterized protein n=1 Tax=hydrothermal vent metagenome TaxID=652676 RepID=A0A3B0WTW4_9ZZZZ
MYDYFPWWLGAISLAAIVIGFKIATERVLSGSGNWARVVLHDNDEVSKVDGPFRKNPAMLADALMKATIEEFGYAAVTEFLEHRKDDISVKAKAKRIKAVAHTPWTIHLTFLVMLVVGGFVASLVSGHFELRANFGELHTTLFGGGMGYWITLITGGFMIGFGTQLATGCSFGHGLGGSARFVPASLVATATFFMTGIIVSVLIHFIITGTLQ